ncbi:Plant Basic Secretory Protein [Aquisphaera giovannonii]|uniref:Plant Basic Secretory Protein n=1 Tax=Aquisphaera giovannonii TaxID=406548 RepID=A0A5B9W958_9BACT|nr:basic secretory protein-like protein [Aquisphaera giovannonii]QEH37148.1 Plant Basic Secretory Protein [Aquisphaera giovannonii]
MAFRMTHCLVGLAAAVGSTAVAGEPAADRGRAKVAMTSPLMSRDDHIRQRAFDGKAETSFRSRDPAKAGDSLTLTFDAAASVKSVGVTTGRPDGSEPLDAGVLEVSEDGAKFERVADFDARGVARATISGGPIRAIRIAAARDLGHPLEVRELAIESDRVKPYLHPFELTVVCDDEPGLKTWADETARLCEQWYDTLVLTLVDGPCTPPGRARLEFRKDYRGVAEAGRNHITASVAWFDGHRDDRGAIIHETVHLIQGYRGYGTPRCPSWLVEGMDDYIRFFVYEPGKAGPVNPMTANYDGAYRTTATFLDFVARKHDPDIVRKLDRALRDVRYDEATWARLTGKSAEALNEEWLASIDAPKDRPRRADRPARGGAGGGPGRPGRGRRPSDPRPTWKEHWFEHDQLVKLVEATDDVAVYFDDDVPRDESTRWIVPLLSKVWKYSKQTYGDLGPDGHLYAIFHQGRYSGGHSSTHFDASHDRRNVIDFGPGPWPASTSAVPMFEIGRLVEAVAHGIHGSPASGLWQGKWNEIYEYDLYVGLGMEGEAKRVFDAFVAQSDDFPRAGTHWFRDFFFPAWRDHGKSKLMASFLGLAARYFPKDYEDDDRTLRYGREMNWGEFVHFLSGAAGKDLRPLARKAFGWPEEWEKEFQKARREFGEVRYAD